MSDVKVARCAYCRSEFTAAEIEGVSCCPRCENPGLPHDPAQDVTVTVNWSELRILGIWAERWASTEAMQKESPYGARTVRAIATELEKQHPEIAKRLPLTFLGELQQLREAYPGEGRIQQNVVTEDDDLSLPPKDEP